MPEKPTYENLAKFTWPLLYDLTSNASQAATDFLGPAGTAIIQRHFPGDWLGKIRIGTYPAGVPSPQLQHLWKAMGYLDEASFQKECDSIDPRLFPVLKVFTIGPGFAGITYDKTIYVDSHCQNDLSLVVHELVHSLQWFHYLKTGFLGRYIKGFVDGGAYSKNPAEVRALAEQSTFKTEANAALSTAGLHRLSAWGSAIRSSMDATGDLSGDAKLKKAIETLTQIKELGVGPDSASAGMD